MVTFQVKNRDTGETELERLPDTEFLHRFLLHILPPGLQRVPYVLEERRPIAELLSARCYTPCSWLSWL